MNPLQAELARFSEFLSKALDRAGDPGARRPGREGRWSLNEILWHLADMEREYFGPALLQAGWEGLSTPAARGPQSLDPYLALERFQAARRENLVRLGHTSIWQAMAEHDARHAAQIRAWEAG